jgi:hypothetical protein
MKPMFLRCEFAEAIIAGSAFAVALIAPLLQAASEESGAKPYKIVNPAQLMGSGGIDYVYADSDGRRLYVPRDDQVVVFDIDTLKSVGAIPKAMARGAAVDSKSTTASAAAAG